VYAALGRKTDALQDFERIVELGYDPQLAADAQAEIRKLEEAP
jgi:hypothetical protein